jgi:hypothetical protein
MGLAILSGVISLIVALAVLGFDKSYLTPRARKRSYELFDLERRLDAYGHLVGVLKSAQSKGEALGELSQPIRDGERKHLLALSYIKMLDTLFTSRARFFSDALLGQWFALLRKDKYSLLDSIVERRAMGSVTYTVTIEDLSKMQEIAESEYIAFRLRWEKLAGIKLESSVPSSQVVSEKNPPEPPTS